MIPTVGAFHVIHQYMLILATQRNSSIVKAQTGELRAREEPQRDNLYMLSSWLIRTENYHPSSVTKRFMSSKAQQTNTRCALWSANACFQCFANTYLWRYIQGTHRLGRLRVDQDIPADAKRYTQSGLQPTGHGGISNVYKMRIADPKMAVALGKCENNTSCYV